MVKYMQGVIIALILAVVSLPFGTAPPPPFALTKFFPKNKNINGKLLVLDYGSLTKDIVIDSVQKCEKACKTVAGCNAFVYCNRAGGCGSSCANHVAKHPKLSASSDDYKYTSLPIEAFGANAPGNGCNGKAWRYGTCTLKNVNDPENPAFFPNEAGWLSGTIDLTVPWQGGCQGKPLQFCDTCSQFYHAIGPDNSNYDACMKCGEAAQKSVGSKTITPKNLDQATKAFACNWCLTYRDDSPDRTYDRTSCYACVPKHTATGLVNLCTY